MIVCNRCNLYEFLIFSELSNLEIREVRGFDKLDILVLFLLFSEV